MDDPGSGVRSQWHRLCLHLGEWRGSFTALSATGSVMNDRPSCVTLSTGADRAVIHQTVAFLSPDGLPEQSTVLEYRSLNRGILFFETGAFSQGSLQFSPFAEFGAEFGFVVGDRRLRAVLQFHPQTDGHALTHLTLIREYRAGSPAPENPHLTVQSLLGTWKGTAQKLTPDWFEAAPVPTQLILRQEGDRLHQHLTTQGFDLKSSARLEANTLHFEEPPGQAPRGYTNQTLLLPDSASCTFPSTIPRHNPFLLEVGWMPSPNLRHRLIRSYDAEGAWGGLTLVTEHRT